MKALNFGDNAAVIGGKRVPYSLLGAGAAILGAFLIWKQMGQGGGFSLGQQSPDLSSLTDMGSGGGGGGLDLGGGDLGGGGMVPSIPVYGLSTPAPIYGPVYAMDVSGPIHVDSFSKAGDIIPTSTTTSALTNAAAAVAKGAGTISSPRSPTPAAPPPVIWTRTGPRTVTPAGNTGGSYTPSGGTGAGLVA